MTTTPSSKGTAFSFEVLPPMRGKKIDSVFRTIERLLPFNPVKVNITTHRSETIFKELENGTFEKLSVRTRPGTVALAATLKERYQVDTVPHIICSGFTAEEIENELIDLSFLGITHLLLLRGDKAKDEKHFSPTPGGHAHAIDLIDQVNKFNEGILIDGTRHEGLEEPFTFGVAGYPEKHEEAMNLESDIEFVKAKVAAGAEHIVSQMFFDNQKFFHYVELLRKAGISVPVIPGIKPLTTLSQRNLLPKSFHIDFPAELAKEFQLCQNNDDVKDLGVEWGIQQARELKASGVERIHFYSMNASTSVERIAKAVF